MGIADKLKKAVMKDEKLGASPGGQAGTAVMPGTAPTSLFARPFGEPILGTGSGGTGFIEPAIIASEVDPQFHDAMLSAMNKVPSPGLQELLLTMDGLAKANVPQNQLCTVALSVVSGKGTTLAQVHNELAQRLAALENDYRDLSQMAERKYNNDAGGKENEVASINQKLTQLEEQKRQFQDQKMRLQTEIASTRQTIDKKKAGLDAAYRKLKQEAAALQSKVSG